MPKYEIEYSSPNYQLVNTETNVIICSDSDLAEVEAVRDELEED